MSEQRVKLILHEVALRGVPEEPNLWPAIRARALAKSMHSNPAALQTARRLGWAFAILIIIFTLAFTVSPAVRAQVQYLIQKIGGLTFMERGRYWYDDQPTFLTDAQAPPVMSLDEARKAVPFPFKVPTWTPQIYNPVRTAKGLEDRFVQYVFTDQVRVIHWSNGSDMVVLSWDEQPETFKTMLSLAVRQFRDEKDWKPMIGPGSIQEVEVNGKPAALVQGIWFSDGNRSEWIQNGHQTLFWKEDDLVYTLSSGGMISIDDMVLMAESAR